MNDKHAVSKNMCPNPKSKPDPKMDGIDHINTHNKSKTELGRMLGQFYHAPFKHLWFGPFNTVEGFWYYIKSGATDDAYRTISGYRAKDRYLSTTNLAARRQRVIPDFDKIVMSANYWKIEKNPAIKKLFLESTLPFDHYYLHGPGEVVIRPRGAERTIEMFELLRDMFLADIPLEEIDYSLGQDR